MAFENGDNVYDYFLDVLLRYQEDSMIFMKAGQIIDYLSATEEFPFNREWIDDATGRVLGAGIYSLSPAVHWYMSAQLESDLTSIESGDTRTIVENVDEKIRSRFLDELMAFCLTYGRLIAQLYTGAAISMSSRLETIMITDSPENRKDQIVRFLRTDGRTFDILFDKESAQKLSEMMDFVANGDRP